MLAGLPRRVDRAQPGRRARQCRGTKDGQSALDDDWQRRQRARGAAHWRVLDGAGLLAVYLGLRRRRIAALLAALLAERTILNTVY